LEELRAYVHAYIRYENVPYFGPILQQMSKIIGPGPEKWYKALYFASTSGLGRKIPEPDHETWEWLERIYGLSEMDATDFASLVQKVTHLPALIPAGSSASQLLVDLDLQPTKQSDWAFGPASVLPIILAMTKKAQKKARTKGRKPQSNQRMGPKVPVQQEAAGRRHLQRPETKVNGKNDVAIRHHFSDFMDKKSGMHAPSTKAACATMLSPFKANAPPVINGMTMGCTVDTGGDLAQVVGPVYPRPGMVYQGRHNVSVAIGTAGFGFLAVANGWGGYNNILDMGYSSSAYALNAFPATLASAGVVNGASCPNSIATAGGFSNTGNRTVWLLGLRLRYVVNDNDASTRAGAVYAYSSPGPVDGDAFADLDLRPWARKFSSQNLAEGNEVCVVAPRGLMGNSIYTGVTMDTVMLKSTGWSGLVFSGSSGATYIVEVEYSVFAAGDTIPPTVTPMVSQAAVDCAVACLAEMHSREPGVYGHDIGKRIREIHSSAEQHTVASLPTAVTSAVWPVVKQLATTGGSALMRWVSSLAGI
jgi:hypothetical protein